MKLALELLRSFAQVEGGGDWHPTKDPLHYALINKRWHLVHPDSRPHEVPGFNELHNRLGDPEQVRELRVTDRLEKRQRRVPVLRATDDRGHPYVLKGAEFDAKKRDGTHPLGYPEEVLETGHQAGEWTTNMLRSMGAPVVPAMRDRVGWTQESANAAHGKEFFKDDDQSITLMPLIHPDTDVDRKTASPWAQRLAGRLEAGEHLLNAPDRHAGNYVKVPTFGPDGRTELVKHGIDYEFTGGGNNPYGVLENLDREGNPHTRRYQDPHQMARYTVKNAMAGIPTDKPFGKLTHKQKGVVDALAAFPEAWSEHEIQVPNMGDAYARGYALAEHLAPEAEYDAEQHPALANFHRLRLERDALESPVKSTTLQK